MKTFMDKDFLLETETAKHLFHDYAEPLPLVDYHCHASTREIYEDRRFQNLAEVWLGGQNSDGACVGDHYKWRLMRANGVSEEYVTGNAPAYDRFYKFVEALEKAIGNPMYHWCHMELRKFFGITQTLTTESAPQIWEQCNEMLRNDPDMTARGLIRKANVAFIGTTDDPLDSLEWHEKIAADPTVEFKVCPSFRPDNAVNIHKPGFLNYIKKLAAVTGKTSLPTAQSVCDALAERIVYFYERGCRASDHGLDYAPFQDCTMEDAENAYAKALRGEPLTIREIESYQTQLILACARTYHRLGIVMQIHYSCLRNPNTRTFGILGADSGYDTMAQNTCGTSVARLLNALDMTDQCPKTILYSLNPSDNEYLSNLIGSFQGIGIPGKLQHGSAWWFNDNKTGMEAQMISLGNAGILGNFVGMLTDSRSFLSYPRHDYFRRIMCNLIGKWVENGEYPANEASLKAIVEGISYYNAVRYFKI